MSEMTSPTMWIMGL